MKKIIPFKKEVMFKTTLSEITSISLEHQIGIKENLVNGNFNVSGSYKINDISVNTENFSYDLPFEINIDDKYDMTNVTIDIDDFYYEIVNNNTLNINIDIAVDNLEEIEIEIEEKFEKEELRIEPQIEKKDDKRCIESDEVLGSIFDNIDDSNETYQSYRVYIVRDGDTIESITQKYSVEKEELEKYNDLSSVKINDKIIIPTVYASN